MKYALTLTLLLLGPLGGTVVAQAPLGDYVVILHGIARSSDNMQPLAEHLQRQGYDVINLDYPSTDKTLEELTGLLHQEISSKAKANKPIHFVGFSMGGLLVRAIIHKHRPEKLGRVVLLATPNKGSEVADLWRDNWLYKTIYGPAGQQLGTDQGARVELLGDVDYELGVVAGNSTIDPLSSAVIPGDDDGKVGIESTKLEGMKDHITVSASHLFFPGNDTVHEQTAHFLKHGTFKR